MPLKEKKAKGAHTYTTKSQDERKEEAEAETGRETQTEHEDDQQQKKVPALTAKVEQKRQFWHTSTHTRTYICSALNAREANASFKAQRKKEEEVDNRTLKDKTADALRRLCFEREEPRVCRLSEGDRGRGNGTAEVQRGVVVEKKKQRTRRQTPCHTESEELLQARLPCTLLLHRPDAAKACANMVSLTEEDRWG